MRLQEEEEFRTESNDLFSLFICGLDRIICCVIRHVRTMFGMHPAHGKHTLTRIVKCVTFSRCDAIQNGKPFGIIR